MTTTTQIHQTNNPSAELSQSELVQEGGAGPAELLRDRFRRVSRMLPIDESLRLIQRDDGCGRPALQLFL